MSEQPLRLELKQIVADVIEIEEFENTDSFVEQLGVDKERQRLVRIVSGAQSVWVARPGDPGELD